MRIVFIHGRAQEGKDPVLLQQQWEAALDDGLERAGLERPANVTIELPYYGDTLDELMDELEAPLAESAVAGGEAGDYQDVQMREDLLDEMREGLNIDESEVMIARARAQKRGPQNWEWVQAVLRALDRTVLGVSTLDAFARDVSVYLTNANIQAHIDAIVKPRITGEPCVVVGHSFGSIVGYNVLRATTNRVVRYVTVGSPLGIKAIKQKLNGGLKMPATTTSWFNAMDERDVVALYPLDEENFPVTPSIVNKTTVNNFTSSRHGIAGYLSDPDVARNIIEPFV